MTKKQLKIQDATNDDNSITKKLFDGKKNKMFTVITTTFHIITVL